MPETLKTEINSLDNTMQMLNELVLESNDFQKRIIIAQINTLKIVQNPMLVESIIDTILENLHQAVNMAYTEEEKKLARHQSCLILQSILFYFHAKLLSEKESTRQKGFELMKVSDEQIMNAIKITAVTVLVSNGVPANTVVDFLPVNIKDKLSNLSSIKFSKESIKGNLLGAAAFLKDTENLNKSVAQVKESSFKIYTVFTEKLNNQKMQKEFYAMLDKVFEKLERNKSLIGSSVVLSELVMNHHKDLISHFTSTDKKKSQFSGAFSGVLIVMSALIFGIINFLVFIIDFFAKTNYSDSIHWYYILLAGIPAVYFYSKLQIKKKKLHLKYVSISNSLRA